VSVAPPSTSDRPPEPGPDEQRARAAASRARALLDRVLSASAGLVALSALGVSVYQTYILREQQRMSAWPYLTLYNSTADGASRFAQNVGLGPALVRSVVVRVDGRAVGSWGEALAAAVGDTAFDALRRAEGGASIVTSTLGRGTVLLPGVPLEQLRVTGGPLVARLLPVMRADRIVTQVCYCSLYADCWTASSAVDEPVPVPSCAAGTAREFRE
jgi:hypothetical protein